MDIDQKKLEDELRQHLSSADSEETQDEQAQEEPKQETPMEEPVSTDKTPAKGIEKLLAQRNAAQQKAKDLEQELQALKAQRGEVSEDSLVDHDQKIIEKISEKKYAEEKAKDFSSSELVDFFGNHPEATKIKDDLMKIADIHPTLSLDSVYKLYQATNDPISLLDDASKARIKGEARDTMVDNKSINTGKSPDNMSQDEMKSQLKGLMAKGELTL